ncbi:hypothetical protein SynA1825c_02417 [Synechococcus sp. A18-25c]|nr:hypothetical protein SynA1825c_02417 [Synechococcus sp. A18-25c]
MLEILGNSLICLKKTSEPAPYESPQLTSRPQQLLQRKAFQTFSINQVIKRTDFFRRLV